MHLLAMLVIAALAIAGPGTPVQASASFTFQAPPSSESLPVVELDALDQYRWSVNELIVAPGQTIQVTNRGVMAHTFTIREWGIDVVLPTLEAVEITVPTDVVPGEQYIFLCSEPGHQANGQEGIVTIVTPEEILATQQGDANDAATERVILETGDDFTWSVPAIEVVPGQFIEVRNGGVLEHHFVVDEWGINETISAGEVKLIQVPDSVEVGQQFIYYCSVPGHRAGGMEGTITVVEPTTPLEGSSGPGGNRRGEQSLDRFLPDATALGTGWSQVRDGNARAVLPDYDNASAKIFPGEGRGATYVGPEGSRATIIVLPFEPTGAPTNQVEDAVLSVQLMMMAEWEADLRDAGALNQITPPSGCDVANRAAGVTRLYTLPAGSTVCQLRSAGIAIFVAVEGKYSDWSGVEAADQVIARLLQNA